MKHLTTLLFIIVCTGVLALPGGVNFTQEHIGKESVTYTLTAHAGGGGPYGLETTQQANVNTNAGVLAEAAGIFGLETLEEAKENALDKIAWTVAKIALQQMSASIQQWIINGFDGSPTFIQDFQGLLRSAADQAVGDFISESQFGFICDPFKLDVQASILTRYYYEAELEPQACTLSGSVENIQNFVSGSFSQGGGWFTWHEMTAQPTNNAMGQLIDAEGKMVVRIANAENDETISSIFNAGFRSETFCNAFGADGDCIQELVETPGRMMHDLLADSFDAPQLATVMADEFNEIVSVLFSQLVQTGIQGASGFLGLSQSGSGLSGGSESYLQELQEETINLDEQGIELPSIATGHQSYIDRVEELARTERRLEREIAEVRAEYPECPDTSSLNIPPVVREMGELGSPGRITDLEQILEDIGRLETELEQEDAIERRQEISNDLATIVQSPDLKNESDVNALESELRVEQYSDGVSTAEDQIDDVASACRAARLDGASAGGGTIDPGP